MEQNAALMERVEALEEEKAVILDAKELHDLCERQEEEIDTLSRSARDMMMLSLKNKGEKSGGGGLKSPAAFLSALTTGAPARRSRAGRGRRGRPTAEAQPRASPASSASAARRRRAAPSRRAAAAVASSNEARRRRRRSGPSMGGGTSEELVSVELHRDSRGSLALEVSYHYHTYTDGSGGESLPIVVAPAPARCAKATRSSLSTASPSSPARGWARCSSAERCTTSSCGGSRTRSSAGRRGGCRRTRGQESVS